MERRRALSPNSHFFLHHLQRLEEEEEEGACRALGSSIKFIEFGITLVSMATLYQTLSFPFFHKSHSATLNPSSSVSPIYATTRNKEMVPHCFPLLLLQRSSSRGRLPLSAIATPNSVLSEEAFKGLGDLDSTSSSSSLQLEDEEEVETTDDDYVSDDEEKEEKDELAIPNLGLPQKLVDSLLKREITRLFPIQVPLLNPHPTSIFVLPSMFSWNCSFLKK